MSPRLSAKTALAIFGHPGHELVVFQWLSDNRAETVCLTDGSGGAMVDRTFFTRQTLNTAGATVGAVMGACSDKQLYADFLSGDATRLIELTRRILNRARILRPDTLLTDSFEYFNPVHDIANTITDIVWRDLNADGHRPRKLVYPNEYPDRLKPDAAAVTRRLTDDECRTKSQAIDAYLPLASEFARLAADQKLQMLETEYLHEDPVRLADIPSASDTIYETAFYEDYGRARVAEGRYSSLITLDGHFRPLAAKLVAAFT